MKKQALAISMVMVAIGLAMVQPAQAMFDNAFDDAIGHWMFGSDGTRLNDNNAPDTVLGVSWSNPPFPFQDSTTDFLRDKNGQVAINGNGSHRLYAIDSVADVEIDLSGSVTTWTRFRWDGDGGSDRASFVGNLMGRHASGSGNYGWKLAVTSPNRYAAGGANGATFYVSEDSTNWDGAALSLAFEDDTYYDIAGVFDQATGVASVYVFDPLTGNMLASGSKSTGFSGINTPDQEFRILAEGVDNVDTYIESAAVWGRALSPTELLYLTNYIPEPGSLVLLVLGSLAVCIRRRQR